MFFGQGNKGKLVAASFSYVLAASFSYVLELLSEKKKF